MRSLRLIAKPGDHWVSFGLKDVFYSLAIDPKDREAFTIKLDWRLMQFCALPMGWSLSPFVFQKLTQAFADHLRDPEATTNFPGVLAAENEGPKAFKKVATSPTTARWSPPSTLCGRFRDVRRDLRGDLIARELHLRLTSPPGFKSAPLQGAFSSYFGGGSSGDDPRFRKRGVLSSDREAQGSCIAVKTLLCRVASHKRWVSV